LFSYLSYSSCHYIVHDFFEPQPVKSAAIYYMRVVIHDWPDAESLKILKNIRTAASPSSRLILFELCIQHVCPDAEYVRYSGDTKSVPYPLLAIVGKGNDTYTNIDMQVRVSRFYNIRILDLLGVHR